MIIVRSPLRVSLGGGGTDLKSYYQNYEGFVISAAIDKYVYVAINQPFEKEFIVKYSNFEIHDSHHAIEHPIVRESLKFFAPWENGIEISTMADLPGRTGLGSSGSFTTALLKALSIHNKVSISTHKLAELACEIEIDILGDPIGKQDQFISAYGGICALTIKSDGTVTSESVKISKHTLKQLEDNLLLFYTGKNRSAASILIDQDQKSKANDPLMISNLHETKIIGQQSMQALLNGDLFCFADLMNVHWETKRSRTKTITNSKIDEAYNLARANGALGGKLVGAGGGGFLMLYANDVEKLRHQMLLLQMPEVRFKFDFEGTSAVLH